jgi:hypothetical protein
MERQMCKLGRTIGTLGLVVAFACALNVSTALADTYEVAICHDPASGLTVPTDGVSFPTAGSYALAGVYEDCGKTGYLYADLDGVAPHSPADFASWVFQAPPGTTIAAVQAYRAFTAGPFAPFQAPIDVFDAVSPSGALSVLDDCTQAWGCSSAGTGPLSEFASANLLDISGLTDVSAIEGAANCGGGESCAAGGGAVCPELGGDPCIAANHLYAMVVSLEDDTAPTASNVSGSLIVPGVLSGVVRVSFDATDTGSGLYSAALTVDGVAVSSAPIDPNGGRCSAIDGPGSSGLQTGVLRFEWAVPCALAGSGGLDLDTSTLHDGVHSVAVTVTDAAGNSSTVWSGTIHTDNAPQGGLPQIFGDAQQGQSLVAGTGNWSPAPTAFAYQWERCDASGANCAAIAGATAPAYTVTAADDYRDVAVSVTASDAAGSTTALSPPSGVVLDADGYANAPAAPAPSSGSLPTISGTTREGSVLSAQPGEWSGGPLTFAYQWQRCDQYGLGCDVIAGALAATYTLVSADDGSRVRVLVSASGPGGTDQAASEPSALIAAAGDAAAAPSSTSAPAAASATQRVANGSGACAGARLRATVDGRSSVTVALGRRVTLRGSLRCAGAPVAGARVELAIAAAAGSTPTRPVQVRTSANGSFSYVLGPGPSRRITASYREFAQDATPTASVSASVLVTPSISLTITPTATTNGHTITFSGRVSGGDEPRGGLPLALEYLEGNRWMIYTLVQASPGDGRFLYRYTFRRTTQSITYTFRMAIPASGIPGYPYQPAASPPRSVHVDP